MANITKICKVCGKRYEGCSNAEKYDDVFRYQTVACSPECGAIYLARVLESRGLPIDSVKSNIAPKQEPGKRSSKKKPLRIIEESEPLDD